MPRDDLSIDFVKKMAPSVEAQDPAIILEEFIHRTANLPEEIRFIQDEIADKDRSYAECIKTIDECDTKIQRFIRQHGSHHHNPREQTLRDTIRETYARADKLSEEKIALAQKSKALYDKHLRYLDLQIKQLSDRGEPGFTDPDEIPSLVRPSAANSDGNLRLTVSTSHTPLNPITNNATPVGPRVSIPQIRTTQSQAHASSSTPTSPAASIILNSRNQRETSAGPGSGAPKRGPRVNSSLGGLPGTSSGLARHSSLGPGTPKAGTPGATGRAGSAGPRVTTKASSAIAGGRKTTPSAAGVGRKKPPGPKSTLSRVKRAGVSKGSPASTADSELSEAESVRSSRGKHSRASSSAGTPVPGRGHKHSHSQLHAQSVTAAAAAVAASGTPSGAGAVDADGDTAMADRRGTGGTGGGEGSGAGPRAAAAAAAAAVAGAGARRKSEDSGNEENEEDGIDEEEDEEDEGEGEENEEDEEGKKYCLCQHISYGDMVACDNPACPFEWFHWTCVGLKSEPEGRWYCPSCTDAMKKKGK
ncbi:PHD-finger domain-containing protein [Durotheca rogersii]|uniref:PHD-finger domain-containing protein n=1 Tax=Durotheca rogersii TaxID=419775 RepID=UPI0022212336|nr:PHD-finger domain-containing protein [Durotheca rogersii]KAI5861759.1 PHD-finger domain-containing protein [Durotheca rogersii]